MPTPLHEAWRDRFSRVRARTTALVVAAYTADVDEFIGTVVPVVLDAQRTIVSDTDAYLSLEAGLATGTSTDPWGVDPEMLIGAKARGVALEDVYARNLRATVGTFEGRMAREVATDMQLAARSTAWVHTAGDPRIVGYRRVLGPGKNCGLCVAASTRRYKRADLNPIHAHCGCSVQPEYRAAPAPDVDQKFLDRLYARAGSTRTKDLSRIKLSDAVTVVDTPELGPTLTAA